MESKRTNDTTEGTKTVIDKIIEESRLVVDPDSWFGISYSIPEEDVLGTEETNARLKDLGYLD